MTEVHALSTEEKSGELETSCAKVMEEEDEESESSKAKKKAKDAKKKSLKRL